jgi:ABC-type xylose transport system permease subunit
MTHSFKGTVARKAAKTGAKHTAHGAASKLKRKPLRAATLLAIGAIIGAVAGWLAARSSQPTSPA